MFIYSPSFSTPATLDKEGGRVEERMSAFSHLLLRLWLPKSDPFAHGWNDFLSLLYSPLSPLSSLLHSPPFPSPSPPSLLLSPISFVRWFIYLFLPSFSIWISLEGWRKCTAVAQGYVTSHAWPTPRDLQTCSKSLTPRTKEWTWRALYSESPCPCPL